MSSKNDWRAPRGTHDILPQDESLWRYFYETVEWRASGFGFGRIETPLFEAPEVFTRALGETTDIVQKEMFEVRRATAEDSDETSSYILRPEGTAGVMRAYLENGMQVWPQPVKLWQYGPMFRADRPQKGRYRQFWYAGFEVIGDADPTTDAMAIFLGWQILGDLGVRDAVVVDINSIGDAVCRPKYKKALLEYYEPLKDKLCATCQTRLDKNPLRLLDCKEEDCEKLKKHAPQVVDFLCQNCREHFRIVLETLDELGVRYELTSTLIRGLDYYTRTTFEFRIEDDERRQGSVGGGGRYDGLLEQFGAKSTPAVGFAFGVDRVLELMQEKRAPVPPLPAPDIFVVQLGDRAKRASFNLIAQLTDEGFNVTIQPGKDSLKAQLRLADRGGVRFAVIIGQREALDGTAILRNMNENTQETVDQSDLVDLLKKRLAEPFEQRERRIAEEGEDVN